MSPTSILKGCMAMLIDVSSNIRAARPIRMADDTASPKLPALGRRHITSTATNAPAIR